MSTDGSAQGESEPFQMHFVSAVMKMAATFLKPYICERDYRVCSNKWSQNNDSQSGLHNPAKGHGQINKCFAHTHSRAHTHMTMLRPLGITDICDTLERILSGTILYPNEKEKAVISPCHLLICVHTNGARCLSTSVSVNMMSLSWQAVRNS